MVDLQERHGVARRREAAVAAAFSFQRNDARRNEASDLQSGWCAYPGRGAGEAPMAFEIRSALEAALHRCVVACKK
jgi:hypothetical protein